MNALRGVAMVFCSQPNAWIMIVAAVVVVSAGIAFHVSGVEWCFLCAAIFLVVIAEMFNTALEALTDLVTAERHPLARKAKDAAAGAVLLAAAFALIVAFVVFGPRILGLLGTT